MVQETAKKFTSAVDLEWGISQTGFFTTLLVSISEAPTTSENLLLTFRSRHGPDFDVVLIEIDMQGVTNLSFSPDAALPISTKDSVQVTYPNTDGRAIGVTLKGSDSTI